MRVVITSGGEVLRPLVEWFECGANHNKSSAWQMKVARAVGLLYDYYVAAPPAPSEERNYLSAFLNALMAGTIAADGTDPTGLFWRPTSWGAVREYIRDLTAFSDFCVAEAGGDVLLNPHVEPSFQRRLALVRAADRRFSKSLFQHLGNAKQKARQVAERSRAVAGPDVPHVARRTPAYPAEKFQELLGIGFRRRTKGEFWEQYNIRDMMIALLQRHGGLRVSEPFNIFASDITRHPHIPGGALVQLVHPVIGGIQRFNALTGASETVSRAVYLRERWGRIPRSQMTGSQAAGWKNLRLEMGAPHWSAPVYWWPASAGVLFMQLFRMYIAHVMPRNLEHPYLFVSLRGASRGTPLSRESYAESLEAANRRIGLETSKELGTSPHGFRHRYARDLRAQKFDPLVIQAMLHHASQESQEVYTRANVEDVQNALAEGYRTMRQDEDPLATLVPAHLSAALPPVL